MSEISFHFTWGWGIKSFKFDWNTWSLSGPLLLEVKKSYLCLPMHLLHFNDMMNVIIQPYEMNIYFTVEREGTHWITSQIVAGDSRVNLRIYKVWWRWNGTVSKNSRRLVDCVNERTVGKIQTGGCSGWNGIVHEWLTTIQYGRNNRRQTDCELCFGGQVIYARFGKLLTKIWPWDREGFAWVQNNGLTSLVGFHKALPTHRRFRPASIVNTSILHFRLSYNIQSIIHYRIIILSLSQSLGQITPQELMASI